MNLAQVHLALNHGPVFGFFFAVLVLAHGLFYKQKDVIRVALWMFFVAALITVPVYLTGDPAEGVVKKLPEFLQSAVEDHENAATVALIAVSVLGVCALGLLFLLRKGPLSPSLRTMFLAAAILTSGWLFYTAGLGGKIHHSETRAGFIPPPGGEEEEHD
jgi:hypothetical protein